MKEEGGGGKSKRGAPETATATTTRRTEAAGISDSNKCLGSLAVILFASLCCLFHKSGLPRKKRMTRNSDFKVDNNVVEVQNNSMSESNTGGSKNARTRFIPEIVLDEDGRVQSLERFSDYVGRQLGIVKEDLGNYSRICKLADDYLIRKPEEHHEEISDFFSPDEDEDLDEMFVNELDICILSYFAYHWNHASEMITKATTVDSSAKKFQDSILAATRSGRFKNAIKDLKAKRFFTTLIEEMKTIGTVNPSRSPSLMVPKQHGERSPVLLLMGGGAGAGKSSVLESVLQEPFWSIAGENAVKVEADAFKRSDVVYQMLNLHTQADIIQASELVHQASVDAASSVFVTALNDGRDVILDGCMSWVPYFKQTVAMARKVHLKRYRMGEGYKVAADGSVTEKYWEEEDQDHNGNGENLNEGLSNSMDTRTRKPYRIELVGIVCDVHLAVVRGMRRAILTGRGLSVKTQLQSHKRFASAFESYCELVDNARLFCTNEMAGPPQLIATKDHNSNLLVDVNQIDCLKRVSLINSDAESVDQLYPQVDCGSGSQWIWKDVIASSTRQEHQKRLKEAVTKIEQSSVTPQKVSENELPASN